MAAALNKPLSVLALLAVVATLTWAKEFFLPIAVAGLISFVLSPVVTAMERRRIPRAVAVTTTCLATFALLGVLIYVVAGQLLDLANDLPGYKNNLRTKILQVKEESSGPFQRATKTLHELAEEITTPAGSQGKPHPEPSPPVPVQVVSGPDATLSIVRGLATPMASALGYVAAAALCVIFFLMERTDIGDRIVHLLGRTQLSTTIGALEEASAKVTKYLSAQLLVNTAYGVAIGSGLYFIGIPNAILWGILATLLRFLPYVGPWLAAALPLALSLAVSNSWREPLLTAVLYAGAELVTSNLLEPWLYGSSTGLTASAVIVSALFWTWIWGGLGLVIATPLTVCLAILGRHLPGLSFLSLLLEENVPISLEARFYQRLIALNEEDALELAQDCEKEQGPVAALDTVIVPAVARLEQDFHSGELEDGRRGECFDVLEEVTASITRNGEAQISAGSAAGKAAGKAAGLDVVLVPANSQSDEVLTGALSSLLEHDGVHCSVLSSKPLLAEKVDAATRESPKLICVCALAPFSAAPAVQLVRKLRARWPDARLWAALWQGRPSEGIERRIARLKGELGTTVFTSFADAKREFLALAGAM